MAGPLCQYSAPAFGVAEMGFAQLCCRERAHGEWLVDTGDIEGGHRMAKLIDYEKSAEAEQWIRDEAAEQDKRYAQIIQEMDDLSEERDVWVEKFFERIQTRGFNVHYDNRRQIPDDELPTRPDRPFKVVF